MIPLLLIACAWVTVAEYEERSDHDGDGYVDQGFGGSDCDDADAEIHSGAREVCDDGVDNNCDGAATGCDIEGDLSLADADIALVGTREGDEVGTSVSVSPDFTTVGSIDVVVGAPGHDGTGAVYLCTAVRATTDSGLLDDACLTLLGANDGDQAGASVLGFRDASGSALLIGAPGYDAD
ncbi:MAG: putative metal-binding motif-containing protein, partial [Myxococcota bacterium]|nr:putative metal-binding motif-containing protein [Myxococcota bacterium]